MGRWLVGAGLLLVMVGGVAMVAERFGIRLGRLPGDIRVEGEHGSFYFPVVTCLLLSGVVSLILWFFRGR